MGHFKSIFKPKMQNWRNFKKFEESLGKFEHLSVTLLQGGQKLRDDGQKLRDDWAKVTGQKIKNA